MDPVGLPSLLAASGGHRIFIYIRGQYGIQKNIYVGTPNDGISLVDQQKYASYRC